MMRLKSFIFSALTVALLSSCDGVKAPPKTVYVVLDTHTQETKEISEGLINELRKRTFPTDTVIVDELSGDQAVNLISTNKAAKLLKDIEKGLTQKESTTLALLDASRRATFIASRTNNLQVIAVSPGIADKEALSNLKVAVDKLSKTPSVKSVSVIGVSAENRLPMSTAFASMPDRIRFVSESEIQKTIAESLKP